MQSIFNKETTSFNHVCLIDKILCLYSSKIKANNPQIIANHKVDKRIAIATSVAIAKDTFKAESKYIMTASVEPMPPGTIDAAPANKATG